MAKLSDFRVLKEDDKTYHIGHPNGKTMVVDKEGLSDKAHAAIKKFASGGISDVPENTDQTPDQMMAGLNAGQQVAMAPQGADVGGSPVGDNQLFGAGAPQTTATPQVAAPAQQQPQIPAGTLPDPLVQQKMDTAGLLNKEEGDINQFTKSTQAANNTAVNAYKNYFNDVQDAQTPDEIYADFKQKDDKLLNDMMAQKVDPNRYLHNMSTASRIGAGIAISLGGLGQAFTGHNSALEQMNNAINNDIDAQKNEQGKQMNLFRMNHEALGDEMRAHAQTQNQLWTGVQAKVAMAAAQAQNPAIKLRGAQMINDIEQQKIQNRMRMGLLTQTENGAPGQPGLLKADPAQLVPDMVPKEQQAAVFGEIKNAQNVGVNGPKMLQSFDDAANKLHTVDFVPGMENVDQKSLHQLLLPNFKTIDGTVRQAAMDETFHNTTPQFGDSKATIATKRQALIDWMHSEAAAPTAKGFGIDLQRFNNTSHQGATADLGTENKAIYQEAQQRLAQNPQDRTALLALKRLGMK